MGVSSSIVALIDESRARERSGDIPSALRCARQALDEARAGGQPEVIAAALLAVARVRFRLGQYDAAKALAEEALTLSAPDSPNRADALIRLGGCATDTNSLAEAEAFFLQAAEVGREIGYTLARFNALHGLAAGIYIPCGRLDLALAADEEAYRIASEHGLREWRYFPLMTMAWTCLATGQCERARLVLEELGQVALPGSWAQGYYCWLAGDLALDEGDAERARALYTQGRSIAEVTGEHRLNIALRTGMSRYYRMADDGPNARTWADDAVGCATRVDYRHALGKALIERARTVWLCGDPTAAEADLRAASEVLIPLQANFDLAHAYLLLAALLHLQERSDADSVWLEAVSRIVSGGYAFLLERERALAFPLVAHYLNSPDPHAQSVAATLLGHLERVPPPPLRIVTLGHFEVWQHARQIDKRVLGQRRAGELLRLLLISPGRAFARDAVIEALWPEKSPEAMQTPFHQATSALRHALEPDLPDKFPSRYLEVESGQVTLHLPPSSWVDWQVFEQNARDGQWEEALALYGGELFPGDRYADWAAEHREWLEQCFLRAALGAARQRLEAGQAEAALKVCRRALAVEPWHEQAVLVGMRACLALNDRAGALRLYCNLERILHEELGAAPQPELEQFYQKVLQAKTL